MKKVRYAAGFIGLAPALGLVPTVAAQTATAPGHPAQNDVKRVSTGPARAQTAAAGCQTSSINSRYGDDMQAFVFYDGHCVAYEEDFLTFKQSGLAERVRYYNAAGTRIAQSFVHGHFVTASGHTETEFNKSVSVAGVYNTCFALVANGDHSDVEYGPLCVGV